VRRAARSVSCLPALLLALAGTLAGADNVRGVVKAVVEVVAVPDFEQTVELRSQELAAFTLPADVRFLDGVQLELVLSGEAKSHYDSFALAVYDRLDSAPTPGLRSLSARRAFLHGLLAMNRLFYVVSFSQRPQAESDLAQGLFALAEPRRAADFPVLVGVVPLAKGGTDSAGDVLLYLKCRPIVRNAGLVTIRVSTPPGVERSGLKASVDGAPIDTLAASRTSPGTLETAVELPAGIHSLEVSAPAMQAAQTTFSVDPGSTSDVTVELRRIAATVTIEAPPSAAIYIDGTKVDFPRETHVGLTAGEHTLRFKLGDSSGARSFTVAEGKSYTISVEVSVTVKEF
jgi:hypothetical protein